MALSCVPWLVGLLLTPPGHEFLWTRQVNVSDLAANLAALERAGAGEQPPTNPYQPEPPAVALVRPTWQLLGLLVAAGVPSLLAYHLGRVVCGVLFLLAVYRLTCQLLPRERQRWLAWSLVALGSGLSWARTLLTGAPGGWPDALQPEATAWSALLDSPHLLLGHWLLVEAALGALAAARAATPDAARRGALRLALAGGLALPDQPFLGPGLVIVSGLALVCFQAPGTGPGRPLLVLGGLGLGLLPGALLVGRALLGEPAYAAWSRGLDSPGPVALLLAAAPLWVLAAVGALPALRPHPAAELAPSAAARRFLLGWALASLLLACSPLPQARRLVEGWTVPLGILAAVGVTSLARRAGPRGGALLAALLVAVTCAGSLDLVRRQLRSYRDPAARHAHYQPRARWELLRRLRGRLGPDDVVLADAGVSLWLPLLSGCRVVHGHPFQGQPPPGRVEAIAAALEAANRAGHAPRFGGPLARVRAVVAVDVRGRGLRTVLLGPDPAGGARVVWLGPPGWAAPDLANHQAAVWLLAE